MKKLSNILYLSLVLPTLAFADFTLASSNFGGIIMQAVGYVKLIIPILMTLATIFFIWGLAKIILNSGSPAQVQSGRSYMFWGIIALFCLLSVSGIISFIQAQFGFDSLTVNGILLP